MENFLPFLSDMSKGDLESLLKIGFAVVFVLAIFTFVLWSLRKKAK